MKKIILLCLMLFNFSAFSNDRVAVITCSLERPYDVAIQDKEGLWVSTLDECRDGDNQYEITFKQPKFFNLDFLTTTDGVLSMTCLGTEIKGVYHGVTAGLAAFLGIEAGAYISLLGSQSICTFLIGSIAGGAELSGNQMIIEKLR